MITGRPFCAMVSSKGANEMREYANAVGVANERGRYHKTYRLRDFYRAPLLSRYLTFGGGRLLWLIREKILQKKIKRNLSDKCNVIIIWNSTLIKDKSEFLTCTKFNQVRSYGDVRARWTGYAPVTNASQGFGPTEPRYESPSH